MEAWIFPRITVLILTSIRMFSREYYGCMHILHSRRWVVNCSHAMGKNYLEIEWNCFAVKRQTPRYVRLLAQRVIVFSSRVDVVTERRTIYTAAAAVPLFVC